jgi:GT2 family glycosyltransferase
VDRDHRVVAVVVTWNRRSLLCESLTALSAQTNPPAAIVVVDNASTDDTLQTLRERPPGPVPLDVVALTTNIGGAGGFAVGIERALAAPRITSGCWTTTPSPRRRRSTSCFRLPTGAGRARSCSPAR